MNGYVLSVTQLNKYASNLISTDALLRGVSVSGEISGFKHHSSGHLYFTLKDENAVIRCVMFRQNAQKNTFLLADGKKIIAKGSVNIYVRDGVFQLYVTEIEEKGDGELYERFLKLKSKLDNKGYFENARKKSIPLLPKSICVITSPTGAVYHDILNVVRRRFPKMSVSLYPVKVQGEGAAQEIAAAIQYVNTKNFADILIVCRGGGSIEDLWAFNEEIVADAIYNSKIPVISAVGHETDYTIADFVSDLRAPTPSAAAELAAPLYEELEEAIRAMRATMQGAVKARINMEYKELSRFDISSLSMRPDYMLREKRARVLELYNSVYNTVNSEITRNYAKIETYSAAIEARNPVSLLKSGYSIVTDADGNTLVSSQKAAEAKNVEIRFYDGSVSATIDKSVNEV